jgi:hypothetical protein
MKAYFVLLAGIVMIGAVWLAGQGVATPAIKIQLRSDPFPLLVGPTDLLVSLTGPDDVPIAGAVVQVSARMNHPGMIALTSDAVEAVNEAYRVPVIWSMAGQWILDISATLPDRIVQEQYLVFVYPTPPYGNIGQPIYHSQREINEVVAADQAHEFWIVIPQGTQQMFIMGEDHNIVPDEIRLQAGGRNTLVIRNDDLADHTVGPFFVRAGETVRQTFIQPATFEGTCSIKHSGEISIIVEA